MKNILLYGDSFFWSVDAITGGRHDFENRVGSIVQKELGEEFFVVTEGLRGRTMFGENGWFPERDGLAQFGPIFASHLPLDLVVIMLGTNDLNSKTKHSATEIAKALDMYKEKMAIWCDFMNYNLPKILIIAPPKIDRASLDAFKQIFEGSAPHISELRVALAKYTSDNEYGFLDASEIVESKNTDGVHLSAEENHKLAKEITNKIKGMTK